MRTTTELTARFNLTSTLIGTPEIDEAGGMFEIGSLEYWEAFEREELIKMRGEEGLLDALDFDTVPFEKVEGDLSVELYEQDLAEDREIDFEFEGYDDDRNDTWEKRKRRNAVYRERRNKISAALLRAKELRPDLNWEPLIGLHNAGWDVLDKTRW